MSEQTVDCLLPTQMRSGKEPTAWLEHQGEKWLAHVRYATLDLSGPYRAVFDVVLPGVTQVADPVYVVKLANSTLDECRRRVQNELFGHRGRKDDPLYRARRLLTKAEERPGDDGRNKLLGLLRAGDPAGHVATTWQAKELIRSLYDHVNETLALEFIIQLGKDFTAAAPPEVRSLGRTLLKWKHPMVAWHQAHVKNGPTKAIIIWSRLLVSGPFATTGSEHFSTPANPTGHYQRPSHPTKIRRARSSASPAGSRTRPTTKGA